MMMMMTMLLLMMMMIRVIALEHPVLKTGDVNDAQVVYVLELIRGDSTEARY